MNQLLRQAKTRKETLEKVKRKLERYKDVEESGKLRISKEKGNVFYYRILKPDDTHGTYISKKEIKTIRKLAQKEYEKKLFRDLQEELNTINRLIKKYEKNNADKVYDSLSEYRKELVNPLIMSDESFADMWAGESFVTNDFCAEQKIYLTEKGEYVRSKSELIIANTYHKLGIPYRYEAELILRNGKKKYPDFTVLNKSTREIVYHEHLGLLDNNDYFLSNLAKIDEYKSSGIYLGKNLILTYESDKNPFDVNGLKKMLTEVFL